MFKKSLYLSVFISCFTLSGCQQLQKAWENANTPFDPNNIQSFDDLERMNYSDFTYFFYNRQGDLFAQLFDQKYNTVGAGSKLFGYIASGMPIGCNYDPATKTVAWKNSSERYELDRRCRQKIRPAINKFLSQGASLDNYRY